MSGHRDATIKVGVDPQRRNGWVAWWEVDDPVHLQGPNQYARSRKRAIRKAIRSVEAHIQEQRTVGYESLAMHSAEAEAGWSGW